MDDENVVYNSMELYSSVKEEIVNFAEKWILLNEVAHTQKDKHGMLSHWKVLSS